MSLRSRLEEASRLIAAGGDTPASTMPEVRELASVTNIFLIICQMPDYTYYSLHTKEELGFKQIPPGWFTKPDHDINLYVLRREHRVLETLIQQKWL